MRRWHLGAEDIICKKLVQDRKDMGLELRVTELSKPVVCLSNSKRRFIFCRLRGVPDEEVPSDSLFPSKNNEYQKYLPKSIDPPSSLFRRFGLIASQGDVPPYLGTPPSPYEELIPLDFKSEEDEVYSRFEIFCVGPSSSYFLESFQALVERKNIDYLLGLHLAWIASAIDYYFTLVPDTYVKAQCPADLLQNLSHIILIQFAAEIFQRVTRLSLSLNTDASVAYHQYLQLLSQMVFEFVQTEQVENWAEQKLGEQIFLKFFGKLGDAWDGFINLCNAIQIYLDLSSPAFSKFTLDIPLRREARLISPSSRINLKVDADQRTYCPIAVAVPDGRLFAFAGMAPFPPQPGLSEDEALQESFVANVRSLAPEEQGYEFTDIVDTTDAANGKFEKFPGKFSITASTSQSYPTLSVRPTGVDKQLLPQSPSSQCYFPKGLGPFIKGVAGGEGQVTIAVQVGQIPGIHALDAQVTVPVTVSDKERQLIWGQIPDVDSGAKFDITLKVRYADGELDLLSAFSAQLTFGELLFDNDQPLGRSWFELTEIVPSSTPGKCCPFSLHFSVKGTSTAGKPILAFVPPSNIVVTSEVSRVSLPQGLRQFIQALHVGEATLEVSLHSNTVPENEDPRPLESTKTIKVKASRVTLEVSPEQVILDDDPEEGFFVHSTLPGGQSFSTGQSFLRAEVQVNPLQMQINNICYDPQTQDPTTSPVDLSYEIIYGTAFEFSAEEFAGRVHQSFPFFGPIDNFIRVVSSGDPTSRDATIRVSGTIRSDLPFDVDPPYDKIVQVKLAPPVQVVLERYDEILSTGLGQGGPISHLSSVTLWRTNKIQLSGHLEDSSRRTKVNSWVNGTECPIQLSGSIDRRTFTITIADLKSGINQIVIEADKPANRGKPGRAEVTFVGEEPVVTIDETKLQSPIGTKNLDLQIKGQYAVTVAYQFTRADGVVISDPIYPDYSYGSFTLTKTIEVQEGTNILQFIVQNPFKTYERQWEIKASKPILEVYEFTWRKSPSSSITHYVKNDQVFLSGQPVDIKGEILAAVQAQAWTCLPGEQFTQITPTNWLPNGSFILPSIQFTDTDKTANIFRLNASNEFGKSTKDININFIPRNWIWNFRVSFDSTDLSHRIDIVQVRTGVTKESNGTLSENHVFSSDNSSPIRTYHWDSQSYSLILTDQEMIQECNHTIGQYQPTGKLPLFFVQMSEYNARLQMWFPPEWFGYSLPVYIKIEGEIIERRGQTNIAAYEVVWLDLLGSQFQSGVIKGGSLLLSVGYFTRGNFLRQL